jgi:hypothetical protein
VRWLTWLRETREATAYMRVDVRDIRRAVVLQIPAHLTRLETLMSADRDFLAELAQDLSDLTAPVDALLASEAALRARVAELEGEAAADEAGDLAAAQPVREQLNLIAGKFAAKPDLPDVTAPDAPAEPVDAEPADEPVAAEPEQPAEQP